MTETTTRVLTREDRCDGCSAAASVVVVLPYGELLFCAHHYERNRLALLQAAAVVVLDERGGA